MAQPMTINSQQHFSGGEPKLSTDTVPTGFGGPFPQIGTLGQVYRDIYGRSWQRVKANTVLTQAAVASNVFYWAAAHGFVIDTDYTDSEATVNSVAGVFAVGQTLPTANQHFWALQGGPAIVMNGTNINFLAGMQITAIATVGIVTGTAALTAAPAQYLGSVHTPVDRSGGAGTVVVDLDITPRSF